MISIRAQWDRERKRELREGKEHNRKERELWERKRM